MHDQTPSVPTSDIAIGLLNDVCRRCGVAQKPKLQPFSIRFTDSGECWNFRPGQASPFAKVPADNACATALRLTPVALLQMLYGTLDAGSGAVAVVGDVACIEAFITTLTPAKSWLATRAGT